MIYFIEIILKTSIAFCFIVVDVFFANWCKITSSFPGFFDLGVNNFCNHSCLYVSCNDLKSVVGGSLL